jgi:hypothetical protein
MIVKSIANEIDCLTVTKDEETDGSRYFIERTLIDDEEGHVDVLGDYIDKELALIMLGVFAHELGIDPE